MKTLYVMRHAKSSWDDPRLRDLDRPLNDRGTRAAGRIGQVMKDRGYVPDTIISSPAARAAETIRLAHDAAGWKAAVRADERVYEAGVSDLLNVIHDTPERSGSAMLIGHNPAMEGIVSYLTGALATMPTAAFAVIALNIENWGDADRGCGDLVEIIRPRDLREG